MMKPASGKAPGQEPQRPTVAQLLGRRAIWALLTFEVFWMVCAGVWRYLAHTPN